MCDVIKLPGAAEAPVLQPARRGRLPKGIGSLYGARAGRHAREHEERQKQRQEGLEQGRRDAKMERLLRNVLAEVNAGQISGLLIALRDNKDGSDHYVCGGVFGDDTEEAADVADILSATLREREGQR